MAAKTMLEQLRGELEALKQKVTDLEAAKAKAIERLDAGIEKAKREYRDFLAEVTGSLGIPNLLEREEKRQAANRLRKQVYKLVLEGKTDEEILAATGAAPELLERVRSKGKSSEPDAPSIGRSGTRREQIRQRYLEGKAIGEIAEELGISKDNARVQVAALKRQGRLEERSEDVPATEGGKDADETDDDDGDSIEDLREEVARQQGGKRSAVARLPAIEASGHGHVAVVDRMGDGVTKPDETGHQHRVYRFVLSMADGHQHGLLAKEAPEGAA